MDFFFEEQLYWNSKLILNFGKPLTDLLQMFMIKSTEHNLELHRQILAASGSNLNRLSKWEVFLSSLTRVVSYKTKQAKDSGIIALKRVKHIYRKLKLSFPRIFFLLKFEAKEPLKRV